jgi:tripartite-type tricarboxylate transporter receptor subunit TctC
MNPNNSPPVTGMQRRALLLGMSGVLSNAAYAQTSPFPNRPIQLIVAAPPGGPSDVLARQLADGLGKELGQSVVIDNRPGAGGTLAAEAALRAAPDGHTLMMSWIGNATAPALLPKVGFDITRDFVHITQMVAGANILVVHPSTGFRTLADLLAHARKNPGRLSYASSGNGSSGHLAMELLKQRAGISMLHIPYRGGAPAMNDLLSGQVDLMFINQDAVIPHQQSGRLVPLAITSTQRNAMFPNLPTVAESGFSGFEATAWAGVSTPKGTPTAVVERMHAAILKTLHGPMRAKQEATGALIVGSTPAQFTQFVREETAKWTQVIRSANIKAD